jgi:CelD/BcsL family acetyltransferase involved in cellulose biosynthesis
VAPYLRLPGSFEEYLAGLRGKLRHEIRRKTRRLQEAFPGARLVDASGEPRPEDLERFLDWHRDSPGEKGGFMQPGMELFFRRLVHGLLPMGMLRLTFLEHEGRKLAGLIAFRWRRRLLLYNSAYDQSLGAVAPGMVLVAELIRDVIATGHEGLDMLKGDLDYKYRFGARPRAVRRLVVTRR